MLIFYNMKLHRQYRTLTRVYSAFKCVLPLRTFCLCYVQKKEEQQIKYILLDIYFWNLQFLNNVSINKTNVPMAIKPKDVSLSLLIRQSHMTSYHIPRKWLFLLPTKDIIGCINHDMFHLS
jgi:hypothetical protein